MIPVAHLDLVGVPRHGRRASGMRCLHPSRFKQKHTCSVRMMEKIKRSQREPRASAYRWSGRITSAAFVAFFFRCRCCFFVAATSPDAQSKRDGHHRYGCCHGGCGGCSCSHNYDTVMCTTFIIIVEMSQRKEFCVSESRP